MSVQKYMVYRDFFQADETLHFSFPCTYCDHNILAHESFFCSLCGVHVPGMHHDEKWHIAQNTPAAIGPICLTCRNTIKASL